MATMTISYDGRSKVAQNVVALSEKISPLYNN